MKLNELLSKTSEAKTNQFISAGFSLKLVQQINTLKELNSRNSLKSILVSRLGVEDRCGETASL